MIKQFIQRWKAPSSKDLKKLLLRISVVATALTISLPGIYNIIPREQIPPIALNIIDHILLVAGAFLIGATFVTKLSVDWKQIEQDPNSPLHSDNEPG